MFLESYQWLYKYVYFKYYIHSAAVFVFVPPSQPLSKYHVVINAGALAFANPVPGSLTRTTKFYATQFSVHRFSDHAGVEQTVKWNQSYMKFTPSHFES